MRRESIPRCSSRALCTPDSMVVFVRAAHRRSRVPREALDEEVHAGVDDAGNGHRRLTAEHRQRVEDRQRIGGDQDAVRLNLRHPREGRVEHHGAGGLVGEIVQPWSSKGQASTDVRRTPRDGPATRRPVPAARTGQPLESR